jgi:hypothetical protein
MTALRNIWDETANILDAFAEQELGEIPEEEASRLESRALAYLEELAAQESNKIDAIGFAQDKAKSQIELLKDQEEKVRNRRKALEKAQERFRQYLLATMLEHGLQKVKGNSRTIFLSKTETVDITCSPHELPEKYRETRIEYKPRKNEIKNALKQGESIEGARLNSRNTVRIR